MIRRAVCLLALLLVPVVADGQRPDQPPRPGPVSTPERRAQLEAQIFSRFMDRITQELKLDAPTRQRLEEQLRQNGERRRALTRSTVQLRQQLVRIVQDTTGTDADAQALLNQFEQLRQQEHELWSVEQKGLASVLTPKQRAVFTLEWMRFNDRVRGMMMERRPPGRRE